MPTSSAPSSSGRGFWSETVAYHTLEAASETQHRQPTRRLALVFSLLGVVALAATAGYCNSWITAFSAGLTREASGASREVVSTDVGEELVIQDSEGCQATMLGAGGQANLLWQVVNENGNVFVRGSPDLESRIVGMRERGAVVLAKKQGDFLALVKEPGFMKICLDSEDFLMKPIDSFFSKVTMGSCPAGGSQIITDKLTCQAVAVAAGVPYSTAYMDPVTGCNVNNGGSQCSKNNAGVCCVDSSQSTKPRSTFKPRPTTTRPTLPPTTSTHETTSTEGARNHVQLPSASLHSLRHVRKDGNSTAAAVTKSPPTTSTTLPTTSTTLPTTSTLITTSTKPRFTTTPATAQPSLFGFAVIRTKSSESTLLRTAYRLSIGIFGCNQWAVYSDIPTWMDRPEKIDTIGIPGPPSQYDKIWLNVGVFARAWRSLLQAGTFRLSEWTIKVDPDAVFFPQRLRQHLSQGNYQADPVVYIRNCGKFNSMQGPLEIFSRAAVNNMVVNFDNCMTSIDQSHIGEDNFMQKCMEMFGVQPASDFSLLQDLYCTDTYYGQPMFKCLDTSKVAYHPLKTKETYTNCLHESGMTATAAVDEIPSTPAASSGHDSIQGTADASGKIQRWSQCGGTGWTGGTECEPPYHCFGNNWFRMCDDKAKETPAPTTPQPLGGDPV